MAKIRENFSRREWTFFQQWTVHRETSSLACSAGAQEDPAEHAREEGSRCTVPCWKNGHPLLEKFSRIFAIALPHACYRLICIDDLLPIREKRQCPQCGSFGTEG